MLPRVRGKLVTRLGPRGVWISGMFRT